MTAVAAMQCVERGQIGLDDAVEGIAPELGDIDVLKGFEEDGRPILRKARTKITLRYDHLHKLLSFTAYNDCCRRRMLLCVMPLKLCSVCTNESRLTPGTIPVDSPTIYFTPSCKNGLTMSGDLKTR